MIEFCSHVKVVNGRFAAILAVQTDQRVDLKVCKVKVHIDGVETNEEVDQCCLLALNNVCQQCGRDRLARRERGTDGEAKGERLGVNITDVDTSFMSEENEIPLTLRSDADVVFGVGRMGEEGLEDEVVDSPRDSGNLRIGL